MNMGEYAKRKKDGVEVKIGTCESMYYCRYEQLKDVEYCYPTNDHLWRIPYPKEDGIEVGEYDFGIIKGDYIPTELMLSCNKFSDELTDELCSYPGVMFLENKLMNLRYRVKCYHGLRHPDGETSYSIRPTFHLCYLKNTKEDMLVGIKCAVCGEMFSLPFNDIEPYIFDVGMKLRLFKQCSEYYRKVNNGKEVPYNVCHILKNGHKLILASVDDKYELSIKNDKEELMPVICGDWETVSKVFINRLDEPEHIKEYYIEKHSK